MIPVVHELLTFPNFLAAKLRQQHGVVGYHLRVIPVIVELFDFLLSAFGTTPRQLRY
jgi:hypothetical protein